MNWSSDLSEILLKHFQALQSQKRSKPMTRCSAVINSSTGFSHVIIIGSGLCSFVPLYSFIVTLLNFRGLLIYKAVFLCFSKLGICVQVQQVWCVQRHWGKRASLIALSCAPWTDTLHMTSLNWVRFVHRPRPHKQKKNWLCQENYITVCRGSASVSGAKTGALGEQRHT